MDMLHFSSSGTFLLGKFSGTTRTVAGFQPLLKLVVIRTHAWCLRRFICYPACDLGKHRRKAEIYSTRYLTAEVISTRIFLYDERLSKRREV